MQFSTDFSQNFTEHPSTVDVPWNWFVNGGFVTMETLTFGIGGSEEWLSGFGHSNYVVEPGFFGEEGLVCIQN